jgi:microcystin-dependent protein
MKKTKLLLLAMLMMTGFILTAQMAVTTDGSSADQSAMLDVKSTDKGILVPRMSAAQRDAVPAPATGLLVYVMDDNNFYFYNGSAWEQFGGGADSDWTIDGNNMVSAVSGNVGIGVPVPTAKLDVAGTVKGTNFQGNGNTLTFGNNSNMQPSLGVNYIIAIYGIYPPYPSQNKGNEPYIGEIVLFAGNYAPQGWAFCNGQLLSIAQNQALFSILGTTYGGNGQTTFALPDLRGRVPVQPGQGPGLTNRYLGESLGTEKVGQ